MVNQIYETGEIPKDCLKSVFIPLHKKSQPVVTLKVLFKIVEQRICISKMKRTSTSGAAGLQSGNGNYREALFAITKCLRLFHKAFD